MGLDSGSSALISSDMLNTGKRVVHVQVDYQRNDTNTYKNVLRSSPSRGLKICVGYHLHLYVFQITPGFLVILTFAKSRPSDISSCAQWRDDQIPLWVMGFHSGQSRRPLDECTLNGRTTGSPEVDQWEGVSGERAEKNRDNRCPLCSGVNMMKGIVPIVILRALPCRYTLFRKLAVGDQRSLKSRPKPRMMERPKENERAGCQELEYSTGC